MTITKPGVRLKETSLKVGVSTFFIFSPLEWHMCTHPREVTRLFPNHLKGSVRAESLQSFHRSVPWVLTECYSWRPDFEVLLSIITSKCFEEEGGSLPPQ